jgi:RNA polymerase sigma factor (sigma-70 family)
MKIDNALVLNALNGGKTDEVLSLTEPLIYFQLHNTGLWARFPNYRDDFVQEGKLATLNAIKEWRKDGGASFMTYLHVLIRNRFFTYLRSMRWLKGEVDYELDPDNKDLIYDMKPLTLYDTIVEEMNKDDNSLVLKMNFLDEYTQDEIARQLNKSQQWVNTTCLKFRDKMRIKYGKMFGFNATELRIKNYKNTISGKAKAFNDFKINGQLVVSYYYSEENRTYTFIDGLNRIIATIGDSDKMNDKQIVETFGDAL